MDKIIQLENKYTREQLYNVLKSKNIEGCSRLKKHDLTRKIIEHKHLFTKPVRRFNQFRFDNSIFSTEKPEQRFNQFKFHQSIFTSSVIRNQNRDSINLNLIVVFSALINQYKNFQEEIGILLR